MSVTAQSFVVDLPEFADMNRFPPTAVNYWLGLATQLMNQERWGPPATAGQSKTLYDYGQEMFVAHNLVLEARATQESANGALPGWNTGAISGKTIDKVSVNYDVASGIEAEAGHWNLTTYGTRFIRLSRMVGTGGFQLGIGFDPNGSLGAGNAWPGPWSGIFPNMNE